MNNLDANIADTPSNAEGLAAIPVQRLVKRQFLNLTLLKVWFEKIASGEKTEEYRTQKPHWQKRLEGKQYDEIHFRNGYAKDAPQMRVECLGITTGEWEGQPCYILKLGKILQIRRPETNGTATPASQESRDAQAQPAIPDAQTNGQPQDQHPA
jgi:hypothetical protein